MPSTTETKPESKAKSSDLYVTKISTSMIKKSKSNYYQSVVIEIIINNQSELK